MEKQTALDYLTNRAADFYALSDKIWDNAEIRFTEKQSVSDYAAFLEQEGFTVAHKAGGLETAFRAEWGNGKPVIGFLGEYDALPGLSQKAGVARKEAVLEGANGHGCGHNLLGIGALMGAMGLKYYLENEGVAGTVVFFGCPAEEGGSGKAFMTREGCFDDLDCALTWHPAPVTMMVPGSLLASCRTRYRFIGTTSHAAAAPEMGRSALDAIELLNVGIQFLREHIPSSARIHYALTDTGGFAPNVVQGHAAGIYQVRAPFSRDMESIRQRVDNIARGAALMTDTKLEIELLNGSSNTVLIPAIDELMYKNLCEIPNPVLQASDADFAMELVRTQVSADQLPETPFDLEVKPYNCADNGVLPGSSDTGDVSWICPLSQFGAATWPYNTAAHTWQVVASGKSDYAHRGELYAGQVIAATAIDLLNSPETIKVAWDQHKKKTKGLSYTCPIPSEITADYLMDALQ